MSDPVRRSTKAVRRQTVKPALTCAICKRRYRLLEMTGMQTIYSICPDCRLDVELEPKEN